ncbi:Uncharacterised protein [Vibrio cholerae]|nr:Uncharacterised protein [Vibrio cholerae]
MWGNAQAITVCRRRKPINSWSILPVKVIAWCASKAATLLCLAAVVKS